VKPATVEGAGDAGESGRGSVLASCLAFSDEKLALNHTDDDAPAPVSETQENPEKQGVFEGEKELHPTGLEPVTFGSVDRCSIQLSYGCKAAETPPS
jgi:hypothetical protein